MKSVYVELHRCCFKYYFGYAHLLSNVVALNEA